MIIDTDRLRLRCAEPKDVEAFVRALNDWDVQQWLSRPPFPYSAEDARAYIAIVRDSHATPHPLHFVIADKESNAALGAAAIDLDADGVGELGYWIDRAHWGSGIAQEAVGALVRHAVCHPGLRRLVAVADPENARSHRLLTACGFADRGLRDRSPPSRRGATQLRGYERAVEGSSS